MKSEPLLEDKEPSPKPEDYPTLQEWNDAYWDWAKRDMHRYIDETWDETFKKAWNGDPKLHYLPLWIGLLAGLFAFILIFVIPALINKP